MKIELHYDDHSVRIIDVPQDEIMEAGIVIYAGRMFMYEALPQFRSIPRFVETAVYTHGSC